MAPATKSVVQVSENTSKSHIGFSIAPNEPESQTYAPYVPVLLNSEQAEQIEAPRQTR